ncbi:MAG: FAD-dependent oxidoreductase [Candidatus Staskawiczbacteria bacterium]|nr:FAD-dependent oxidoreductase [Candidatus Staskawiczbacteria bacterium]MBI3337520.1 FAD-dependent oxidoreductase [Candidatus Staskawiczbacteria bacterium]
MVDKINIYDLIIIGAGPAGVSAAIYAARQRLEMLIISKDLGGQVAKKAVDIENYPGFSKISGPDLVNLYDKQLKANNLKIEHDEVIGIEKDGSKFLIKTKSGEVYESISVIVTSGAESKKLSVPGEEEFAGKGVSYCSLCDGPLFSNKIIAVVGGGNNGFESALFLSNYVKKIYILEYSLQVKADRENQDLVLKHKNIEIITNAKVLKIDGENFVNSITYEDLTKNKEVTLKVDGVFVEIGYVPSIYFVKDLVDLDEKDEIIFDPKTLSTKTPGLFSAGDCNVSRYKQIVMASGQGAIAALSAYEYIKKNKHE